MRKNLSAIGNSLRVLIEKPILELLNITRDTEIEVTMDCSRLIIELVRTGETEGRRGRVRAAAKRVMKNHERTLHRLAE